MNVCEVIGSCLQAAGIGHVFSYPGDPSVEFLEAIRRQGMQFVLGTREGTAGLMACAYGQLTGRPGVAVDSAGALETALRQARTPDRPLVIGARIDPAQYAAQF